MRRRKRRKMSHMKSTMFIMIIIALSSIGVGYGAWNEGLNMDLSLEAGELDLRFASGGSAASGAIKASPSADGKILYITGEVISGYSRDVTAEVENTGSVPGEFGNTGEEILPNQVKEINIPINVTYSGGTSSVSLQRSMMVESIESEEDIEKIVDEMVNNMYPVQSHTSRDTYYFEQGL